MLAGKLYQRLLFIGAHLPEFLIGDIAYILVNGPAHSQPPVLTTGFCPDIVGFFGIPCWHMHTISYISDGHFINRPFWEKLSEQMTADLSVQTAYPVD